MRHIALRAIALLALSPLPVPLVAQNQSRIYYAPDVNLEQADLAAIQSARHSIDAALYSATDTKLCDALADAERRGVAVRVYRDRQQYEQELQHAGRWPTCTTRLLQGGAAVRIRAGSELMHLKSYAVDEQVLRTGSANLSISGEKYEDNDAVFLYSQTAAIAFEQQFQQLWNRSDNQVPE